MCGNSTNGSSPVIFQVNFLSAIRVKYEDIDGDWVTAPQVYAFTKEIHYYPEKGDNNDDPYDYLKELDTTWILVEKVSGNLSDNVIEKSSQKNDEKACKSGYWVSPAAPNSRNYLKKGESFPTQSNKDWGEVYWYFDGDE